MATDFYHHPELYDTLLPVRAEVPFYAEYARQQVGGVLELACGTGAITVPIALLGQPTIGLDASQAMLNAAKARAASAGAPATFVAGDMRNFALGRTFGLVFVARNSLLHLLSIDDLVAALTSARRHLAADGLFVFDIFNPDVGRLARARGQRTPVMELETARFGRVRVEETSDYDAATQVNRATWYVSAPDRGEEWTMPLVLRSIFPQELPLLLAAAGLQLIDRFGELTRTPFTSQSRVQVCVCRATR